MSARAWRWARLIVLNACILLAALLVRRYVGEPYVVPSASMEPTLMVGDTFIGTRLDLATRPPEAGDVVTFDDPEDPGRTLVKRVVATSGQTVDIHDGALWVDGRRADYPNTQGVTEPIAGHAPNVATDVSYPITLGEGQVFVMGDNREHSLDSRWFGPVDESAVSSRAWLRYWPWDRRGFVSEGD